MIDTRRRLPHWVPDAVPVFVTWRLAGTLPRRPPAVLTAGERFVAHDRSLDFAVSGPVWLSDRGVAGMIVEALKHGPSRRHFYALAACVVMPNHVHVLWQPNQPLPEILRWLKGTTAHRAKKTLNLSALHFWQDESYDHWVRSGNELQRIVRYIEWNPVKAGCGESDRSMAMVQRRGTTEYVMYS